MSKLVLVVPLIRARKQAIRTSPSSQSLDCAAAYAFFGSTMPALHTCVSACSESNPDEAKLAWLWHEYDHSAQSDVKVLLLLL